MPKGFFKVPVARNEPVLTYAPGSRERTELQAQLKSLRSVKVDLPMYIGGENIYTDNKIRMFPPHEINHTLGFYNQGDESHIKMAINAALRAKKDWPHLSWEHRSAIFLKAAELLAGPFRSKINAATMLGQSKKCFPGRN